jgi:hypothetical protein
MNTCETCKFWVPTEDPEYVLGECRRYAPRSGVGELARMMNWPMTESTQFCGEYEVKTK